MFFVIFWTALVRYTWLSNSSRFFFRQSVLSETFGCFWSQWPTSLAVTSGCPTMRWGRLPSRSDVNISMICITFWSTTSPSGIPSRSLPVNPLIVSCKKNSINGQIISDHQFPNASHILMINNRNSSCWVEWACGIADMFRSNFGSKVLAQHSAAMGPAPCPASQKNPTAGLCFIHHSILIASMSHGLSAIFIYICLSMFGVFWSALVCLPNAT